MPSARSRRRRRSPARISTIDSRSFTVPFAASHPCAFACRYSCSASAHSCADWRSACRPRSSSSDSRRASTTRSVSDVSDIAVFLDQSCPGFIGSATCVGGSVDQALLFERPVSLLLVSRHRSLARAARSRAPVDDTTQRAPTSAGRLSCSAALSLAAHVEAARRPHSPSSSPFIASHAADM